MSLYWFVSSLLPADWISSFFCSCDWTSWHGGVWMWELFNPAPHTSWSLGERAPEGQPHRLSLPRTTNPRWSGGMSAVHSGYAHQHSGIFWKGGFPRYPQEPLWTWKHKIWEKSGEYLNLTVQECRQMRSCPTIIKPDKCTLVCFLSVFL